MATTDDSLTISDDFLQQSSAGAAPSPATSLPDLAPDCATTPQSAAETDGANVHDLNVYWPVSLCFWCFLLLAAGIYGAVAVAPKLAVWNSIRHQHQQNARELQQLEDDVDYLQRVETALQTDPEFLQRLKHPTAMTEPGEQSIAISGDLLFGYETMTPPTVRPQAARPPLHGVISSLATRRPLRRGLLMLSAGLTIFAFTFLNDAGVGLVATTGRIVSATATLPLRRYVRGRQSVPEATDTADQTSANAAGDVADVPAAVS